MEKVTYIRNHLGLHKHISILNRNGLIEEQDRVVINGD
jgi:hypothetical protein